MPFYFAEVDSSVQITTIIVGGVLTLATSVFGLVLALMAKGRADDATKTSQENQHQHKVKLDALEIKFDGKVEAAIAAAKLAEENAIRLAKAAAEAAVRSAFARGVDTKGIDGQPPIDPEIMADAQRRNVLPGNGPPIANSDITEQNFGKP